MGNDEWEMGDMKWGETEKETGRDEGWMDGWRGCSIVWLSNMKVGRSWAKAEQAAINRARQSQAGTIKRASVCCPGL